MQYSVTNQNLLYGIVGLIVGIIIAGQIANNNVGSMMRMMGMGRAHDMMNERMMDDHSSSGMGSSALATKRGDEFDREFIAEMIAHHEGAINMANLAKQYAGHEEIKQMADDIIAAQSREIDQMRTWHKDWFGIEVSPNSRMMSH